jgi:AraC-like DNA-binding protein
MTNRQTETELLLSYITSLWHIKTVRVRTLDDLNSFLEKNILYKPQLEFWKKKLREVRNALNESLVLHIHDSLGLQTDAALLDDEMIIFGPYINDYIAREEIRKLIRLYNIEDFEPFEFQGYLNHFPVLEKDIAKRTVLSLFSTLESKEDTRTFSEYDSTDSSEKEEKYNRNPERSNYSLQLENRYVYEQNFRRCLAKGNQKGALLNLANMEQDVAYLKREGSSMERERIGAAIVRTTARLTVLDAGLPAVVADKISRQNTIETLLARNADEVARAKEKMVAKYCKAIQDFHSENYSALTRSVIYEMEQHFHDNLTLDYLAGELAVSKNYMIQRFREETGQTPIAYLNEIRMKRAALLLSDRKFSIQDIAIAVGINSASYFGKQFREYYNESPADYRKRRYL